MNTFGYDTQAHGRGGRSSRASREMFYTKVLPTLRESQSRVYELILAAPDGCTPKEAAEKLRAKDHAISGRFSELRDEFKLIRRRGDRRKDSAVYVPVVIDEVGNVSLFQEEAA